MAFQKKYMIHWIDCGYFAVLYAGILMIKVHFRVEMLQQLRVNKEYIKLNKYQRNDVHLNIRMAAKELFYAEGYPRETVKRIFSGNS